MVLRILGMHSCMCMRITIAQTAQLLMWLPVSCFKCTAEFIENFIAHHAVLVRFQAAQHLLRFRRLDCGEHERCVWRYQQQRM